MVISAPPFLISAGRELAALRREFRHAKRSAFADGTRKNLRVQWKSYVMFCMYFDLTIVPADKDILGLYIQFLARSFKSVDAIRNYLSGIKLMHMLLDVSCPSFSALDIKLALRGLDRLKQHSPKRALPITPELLMQIRMQLDMFNHVHVTFWSLCLIAFFCMARKSNLVPQSAKSFDVTKQLCRQDILVGADCMLVTFKWGKTNQFNKRRIHLPLMHIPGSLLCPVRAFLLMVGMVPAKGRDPAFAIMHGNRLIPFSYPQFQAMLKCAISQAGLDPDDFSSHSFRRGGASTAFRAHVSSDLIQAQGDWASDCYKRYLDFSLQDRAEVSSGMASHIRSVEMSMGI